MPNVSRRVLCQLAERAAGETQLQFSTVLLLLLENTASHIQNKVLLVTLGSPVDEVVTKLHTVGLAGLPATLSTLFSAP
ncbi:hypothetical protein AAFF_G00101750 [Aldrovandia affinis]|uniref:Uncharacterized protein n=1 Tax=Aldrovandia affinis TaxID=143900 RepID=A0AAD7WC79_9TELE|nr:hypothetical protein AAFF_G00101750 [Aldrovandia affinis]